MDTLALSASVVRTFSSLWRREDGQALVEYAMILFLVALVTIGVLGVFGGAVSSLFSVVNSEF
jgi:Flp pilus assembly pilin Flp